MKFFLVLALLLQAAGERQVQVTVVDKQGLAIEGARITVTENPGSLRKIGVTGTDGTRIEGLPAAMYDVRIDASGFADSNSYGRSPHPGYRDVAFPIGTCTFD